MPPTPVGSTTSDAGAENTYVSGLNDAQHCDESSVSAMEIFMIEVGNAHPPRCIDCGVPTSEGCVVCHRPYCGDHGDLWCATCRGHGSEEEDGVCRLCAKPGHRSNTLWEEDPYETQRKTEEKKEEKEKDDDAKEQEMKKMGRGTRHRLRRRAREQAEKEAKEQRDRQNEELRKQLDKVLEIMMIDAKTRAILVKRNPIIDSGAATSTCPV